LVIRRGVRKLEDAEDPDANLWLVQEVTTRLPGRLEASTTAFTPQAGNAHLNPRIPGCRCCDGREGAS
jgi:hypothetical protein